MKTRLCILISLLCLSLTACGGKSTPINDTLSPQASAQLWQDLSLRLQADGLDARKTRALFSALETLPSLKPMGTKVKELYFSRFIRKPAPASTAAKPSASPNGIPKPWFKGVVTRENAQKCREFIKSNFVAFRKAEVRYGVPREVGAALLFVETRLGTFTGSQNAFYSLASMSVKRSPEAVVRYVDDLPGAWQRLDWIEKRMEEKSEWAYKELKALLEYCWANGLDPMEIPGSIYGAIGMCQFMPSNIDLFAEDGNGDGVIDLFTAPDAILSLSRYLSQNGWREGMDINGQVKALMRYNSMSTYAYTILALAKTIEDIERPASVKRKAAKKNSTFQKTPAKKKAITAKNKTKSDAKKSKRWVTAKGRDVTPYLD